MQTVVGFRSWGNATLLVKVTNRTVLAARIAYFVEASVPTGLRDRVLTASPSARRLRQRSPLLLAHRRMTPKAGAHVATAAARVNSVRRPR